MKTKVLLAALMMILMSSCQKGLGEYVYMDKIHVVHTDKECLKKNYLKSENSYTQKLAIQGVMFIKTKELPQKRYYMPRLCPHCVTDRQAKLIQALYK